MVKMIHKKPGTKAYEKALRKSASRMARDWIRNPRAENWQNYQKNKKPEEHEEILRLVTRLQTRRIEKIKERKKMVENLGNGLDRMMKGINRLITKALEGDLDSMIKAKYRMEAYISLKIDFIQEMLALEKQLPIKEAKKMEV